jgi:hypothetical protein
LLQRLARLSGARTQESVHFRVDDIGAAIEQIKTLGGTGQLVLNYANGKPNGHAEWRPAKEKP